MKDSHPEHVVLVDEDDREIGTMEKLEAHKKGLLHRAFSVFLFDAKGRWLLQQRAFSKYHSGGLWTNACCSHPRPGEPVLRAAERRLSEELGASTSRTPPALELDHAFSFIYRADLDHGLTEHELDHVLTGHLTGKRGGELTDFSPHPDEVAAVRWVAPNDLAAELHGHPERFTVWFRLAYEKVAHLKAS